MKNSNSIPFSVRLNVNIGKKQATIIDKNMIDEIVRFDSLSISIKLRDNKRSNRG